MGKKINFELIKTNLKLILIPVIVVFPEVAKLFAEKVKQLFSLREAQLRAEKEAKEKARQERINARRNKRGMER